MAETRLRDFPGVFNPAQTARDHATLAAAYLADQDALAEASKFDTLLEVDKESPLRESDPVLWCAHNAVDFAEAIPLRAAKDIGSIEILMRLKALAALFRREHNKETTDVR